MDSMEQEKDKQITQLKEKLKVSEQIAIQRKEQLNFD